MIFIINLGGTAGYKLLSLDWDRSFLFYSGGFYDETDKTMAIFPEKRSEYSQVNF